MHCINFDRIVTVTHYTSPIKVGATVGIAFSHVKPDEESYLEITPFYVAEVAETNVGRAKSRIDLRSD